MSRRRSVIFNAAAGVVWLSLGVAILLKLLPLALDAERTRLVFTSTLNPTLKVVALVIAVGLGVLFVILGGFVLVARRTSLAVNLNLSAGTSIALFLIVLETTARVSLARNIPPLNAPTLYANVFCGETYWRILARVRPTPPMRDEVYHPELGWTEPRSSDNPVGLAHGGPVGEGLPIPFYGDSFMQGLTDAEETVPGYVASLLPGIQADNLGVGGYGVGQIMLRYRLTAGRYPDRPAVVGIMTEDIDRTPLRLFSGALKPAFVLGPDGAPELIQVPVPRDVEAWLKHHPIGIHSYALASLGRALEVVSEAFDGSNSHCMREEKEAVNLFALEQGRARKVELSHPWVGVIFASPGTFTRRDPWRREFLRSYFERHDIPYVDGLDVITRDAQARGASVGEYFLPDGHPNALGNKVIAQAVVKLLKPLLPQVGTMTQAESGGAAGRPGQGSAPAPARVRPEAGG